MESLRGHLVIGTSPPFLVDLFRNLPSRAAVRGNLHSRGPSRQKQRFKSGHSCGEKASTQGSYLKKEGTQGPLITRASFAETPGKEGGPLGEFTGLPRNGTLLDGAPQNKVFFEGATLEGGCLKGAPREGAPPEGGPPEGAAPEGPPPKGAPPNGAHQEGVSQGGAPLERTFQGGSLLKGASFEGAPCNDFVFFLSHFHFDHYSGLGKNWNRGPVFCSNVTGESLGLQLVGLRVCGKGLGLMARVEGWLLGFVKLLYHSRN